MATMQFSVRLPAEFGFDGSVYVSRAPSLDLYTQGDTAEEARENLKEAIVLFIESCFRRGTLDEVLRACGFDPTEEVEDAGDKEWLEVPLNLVAAKGKYGATRNSAH